MNNTKSATTDKTLVCLDLSEWLTRFEDSRDIKATPFDSHPSAEAHRATAEALYEKLEIEWPGILPDGVGGT